MNKEKANQLKLQLKRELCKSSFSYFVKEFWEIADGSTIVWNWHLDFVCTALEAVVKDEIQNLYIAIPPGSGKSMIVSVMYPVWVWLNDPLKSFLSTGHTMSLNTKFCEKSLRFMYQQEFMNMFPEIQMDPNAKAKASYRNLDGGYRYAASFGGLTGNRANYVLVDDPITVNDAKNSPSERNRVNDIFLNALQSRLNDPQKDHIICIMQRTHVDDIIGIIEEKGMNYDSVVIPMEYTGNKIINEKLQLVDPRDTNGQLMFPERFSEEVIKNYKTTMSKIDCITQYQETPIAQDGNLLNITRLNHYNVLPPNLKVYISTDNAITGNGDYNVITVWGIDNVGNYYLVDYFHEKCQLLDTLGLDQDDNLKPTGLLPFIKRYSPICMYPENDNAFKAIEPVIRQKMITKKIVTNIKPISTHGGNKEAKAQAFALAIEQGKVYIPTYLDTMLIDQMNHFPLAKSDDFVDSCANFFRSQQFYPTSLPERKGPKVFDYNYVDKDEHTDSGLY